MRNIVLGLARIIARFVEFSAGENVLSHELLETELVGEDGAAIGVCVIMTHGKRSTIVDAWLDDAWYRTTGQPGNRRFPGNPCRR